MKNMYILSIVAAVAIMAAGCCSMCKHHRDGDGKCQTCGMMSKKHCPQCNMTKGECKCAKMAEINTAALKSLIDSGTKVTLIDARTGKYDDGRGIPGAINLSPDASDAVIMGALPSKDAMIVTYCVNTKCPASRQLAGKLIKMGYKHVLEYPQGIEGWVSDGNPIKPASK